MTENGGRLLRLDRAAMCVGKIDLIQTFKFQLPKEEKNYNFFLSPGCIHFLQNKITKPQYTLNAVSLKSCHIGKHVEQTRMTKRVTFISFNITVTSYTLKIVHLYFVCMHKLVWARVLLGRVTSWKDLVLHPKKEVVLI